MANPCLLPFIACVLIGACLRDRVHSSHHAERPARSEDGRAATGAGGVFLWRAIGSEWRGGVWDFGL